MNNHMQRLLKKFSGGQKFLICVFGLYLATLLFKPVIMLNALTYFGDMATKVIPILILVFIVLFLTNLFLNPARIKKHLGKKSGVRGWLYAMVAGIVITGPPYVLYPMLGELKKNGARVGLLAAMLYNRNVKIYFIPAIIYYFGLRYTIVLSSYILFFSLLNGKLVELFVKEEIVW